MGFRTVEIMPPLVMVVDRDKRRLYLCGRGVGAPRGRPGLPARVLDELDDADRDPASTLAERGYYCVHDAGVERLMLDCRSSGDATGALTTQELWDLSTPAKVRRFGSPIFGVRKLLDEAARPAPDDSASDAADLASWRGAGPTADASVVFREPSGCFPGAVVEVLERRGGWRTVGLRAGTRSIYHGIYNVRDPTHLIAEHLKTVASLALAALGDAPRPLTFCHLGHGAGALPRFLGAVVPSSRHVSVDLDAAVCDATPSRRPDAHRVVRTCGLDFARRSRDAFDCVVVDIFDADNVCPSAFSGDAFLDDVLARLAPGGVLVHNLHVGGATRDGRLAAAQAALSRKFPHGCFRVDALGTSTFSGNALLLACTAPLDRSRLGERAANARRAFGLKFDAAARVRGLRRVN